MKCENYPLKQPSVFFLQLSSSENFNGPGMRRCIIPQDNGRIWTHYVLNHPMQSYWYKQVWLNRDFTGKHCGQWQQRKKHLNSNALQNVTIHWHLPPGTAGNVCHHITALHRWLSQRSLRVELTDTFGKQTVDNTENANNILGQGQQRLPAVMRL